MADEELTAQQNPQQPAGQVDEELDEQPSEQSDEQPPTAKNVVTIEQAGPCKKKVAVEIPQETIKNATDKQYNDLRRNALVPGFRKGRAPRRLLEKRFGKETSEQIKLTLMAEATEAAIKDLQTIGEPDIDFEEIKLPAEGPLKFDFQVEVRPEFDLPTLEGIPVQRPRLEVTDEQVTAEIDQLRKWSGVWTPRKEGPVELDDQIVADVVLKAQDAQQEEKLDNIEIFVRHNGFVGGIPVETLDEILVGAMPGQSKQAAVEVPKTYYRQEYRGKKVDLAISVKDVKFLKPADLDESLLEKLHVASEDELRERTRDVLHDRIERASRADMADQIYRYLLDNTSFDLPLDIVAEQALTVLKRQYASLLIRGLSRELVDEQMDQLRASSEERARQQLKTLFIMDKVADSLAIEVTEEQINGHIAQLAAQRGIRPERMRDDMVRDGSLAQFSLEVRQNKTIEKLLESANITESEPEKKPQKAAKKPAKKAQKAADQPKKTPKKPKSESKKKTES